MHRGDATVGLVGPLASFAGAGATAARNIEACEGNTTNRAICIAVNAWQYRRVDVGQDTRESLRLRLKTHVKTVKTVINLPVLSPYWITTDRSVV